MEEEKFHPFREEQDQIIPLESLEEQEILGNNSDIDPPELLVANSEDDSSSSEEEKDIALEIDLEWGQVDQNGFETWAPEWIKPFEENTGLRMGKIVRFKV